MASQRGGVPIQLLSVYRVALRRNTLVRIAAGCVVLIGLCGCGPRRVRADFKNYEGAYAETSNHQLLLNLARLGNHDPAYFFKLGQITSSYRMQGSLTGMGQVTPSNGVTVPNGGGTTGLIFENDPTFQFIPVNDDTNARLLMEPIPAETFDALFQQGWRLDQLFRLLVDRIEITRPQLVKDHKASPDCEVEIIRNLPPNSIDLATPEDREELSSYVTFLRVSALAYQLQRRGHLVLGSTETFVPYSKDVLPAIPKSGNDKDKSSSGANPSQTENGQANAGDGALQAKDLEDAADKNNIWQRVDGGWLLGHNVFTPVFYLTPMKPGQAEAGQAAPTSSAEFAPPDESQAKPSQSAPHPEPQNSQTTWVADLDQIEEDINLNQLAKGNALHNVLTAMAYGFSIESMGSLQDIENKECSGTPNIGAGGVLKPQGYVPMSAKLILRSLMGVMAAAAQEQKEFEQLQTSTTAIPPSPYDEGISTTSQPPAGENNASESGTFSEEVPPIEQIPLLQISWGTTETTPPLVQLTYRGQVYMVGDKKQANVPENQYWNRDMFRLINALTSQVTVDISKFPIPEILQLHSD